jgi:quercetin dioxygenase-like cupin family protein
VRADIVSEVAGKGKRGGRAVSTVLIENDRVRVTEWRFEPGTGTGWHKHEFDYVVVPLVTGRLRLEEVDSTREVELATGLPYFREAGVEHDVVNANDYEFVFIETEIKRADGSRA